MSNSIVKKIFISTVLIFILVMCIQLIIQNNFMEDIYVRTKVSKMKKEFKKFVDKYEKESWSQDKLNVEAEIFESLNLSAVIVMDKENNIVNDDFFKSFNYVKIKTEDGEILNLIADFLIDEEGRYRYEEEALYKGDKVEVLGIKIAGTNFVEVLNLDFEDVKIESADGYLYFHEVFEENEEALLNVHGEVLSSNKVIRDMGVMSYQQEKLWNEIKMFLMDTKNEMLTIREDLAMYDFFEEYSGLTVFVLNKTIKVKGEYRNVFSLFTVENVHDAFRNLNIYYYYIFAFQILLILVLVYFYSKWITKPLLKLIEVAKDISKLNFSNKADIKSNDELEVLANSLNNISENLSETIEKLETSNDELAIEAIKKQENEERMRNLLSSLSHEFKTPLGIISGFIEIINDGVYEKEPEYYFNVISEEVDRLNGLVLETIELSKLESGSYKLNLSEFEIKAFVENIIFKFEKKISDKNMKLKLDIKKSICRADAKKIEQVIKNLVSNAIRYSPEHERIEIFTEIKNGKLYFNIENYGVEISNDELDKIWERFYRTDKSRNKELGGTGLGLTIVKNILNLHDSDYGAIKVEEGLRFYFSLDIIE